ncbi:hypothetical protein Hypma_007327 [Hypsizygus marmoreus]|uniref:Uncharacterized protein n=1 Tax=Hypsizygus marmoreus TaxID=39966 RepID=A0A369KCZ7_HYPMA|nr:hypothetical protein Hypma_007327 [Hypsizygus marmoreus]
MESSSQTHLTEKLLLLQELGYSDRYIPEESPAIFRYRSVDDSDTDSDLRLLDVIATCLTTGKPGDVVAAAFDKREQISLVLAKSGNIDAADYAATRAFLSALREAESWINLLPFLATHSKQNVDKRVRNLHESITDLCDELKLASMSYQFPAIINQFPHSSLYRKAKYPKEPPTPQRFLFDLIDNCVRRSTGFGMEDNAPSRSQYIELFGAADSLRRAAFLTYLTSKYYEGGDSMFKGRVERLKRRLDKVCQYARIETLMRLVKRLPSVPFRWTEDHLVGTGEGSSEIRKDPMKVVEEVLGHSPSPQQTRMLSRHCPELGRNWEQRRSMILRIHPEICIILHLSRPLLSRFLSSQNNSKRLPIGCSKRSCLCCMLWIATFNKITGMSWVASSSNGKPYDNWALPGAAGEMKLIHDWNDFDKMVIRGVHRRLYNKLNTMAWENSASSDSEET